MGRNTKSRTIRRINRSSGARYEVTSKNGENTLRYDCFNVDVQGQGIDVEKVEYLTLYGNTVDPRGAKDQHMFLKHSNTITPIFAVRRKISKRADEVSILITFVNEEPDSICALRTAIYDAQGYLDISNDGVQQNLADIDKPSQIFHSTRDMLLPRGMLPLRIDMQRTIEDFMKQVNGNNKNGTIDYGTPALTTFHSPKY